MNKEDELHSEITKIWQILLSAKECLLYSFYLHKPNTKEEVVYLNESVDFIFIRGILWKMAVTELSKLFTESKKRDRFNIFHFISKHKKDGYFRNQGIDDETITKWENEIENNKQTIKEIITLRDKAYSHTDVNFNEHSSELTFEQTEKLILIIEEVIKDIYIKVFNSNVAIDEGRFNRETFDIIKILATEKQKVQR